MIATMTSKGQLTIPKDIRTRLRLKTGDKVVFTMIDDHQVRLTPLTYPITALKGLVPKPDRTVTLEEMDAAIELEAGSI